MGRVMIHQRNRLTLRQLVVAAGHVVLILSAAPLRAQGSVYTLGAGSWRAGTVASGGFRCGVVGIDPVPGPTSTASCKGGPQFSGLGTSLIGRFESLFQTDAFASAVNGSLKSRSSVSWFAKKYDASPAFTFPETGAVGESTARWDDRAQFNPIGPGGGLPALKFIDILFRVDGQITGVEGLNYLLPGFGTAWVGTSTGQVNFAGGTQASSFFANQTTVIGARPSNRPPIPQFQTLRIGVNGLSSDPFRVLLSTQANVSMFNEFFVDELFQGSMDSAFDNTVTPVSYSLWDDLGADVTGQYAVTFDNGMTFESQSVVPEPSTLLLLSGDLLVLVIGWRQKVRPA